MRKIQILIVLKENNYLTESIIIPHERLYIIQPGVVFNSGP